MAVQYEVDHQLKDRLRDLFGNDSDNEKFASRRRKRSPVSSAVCKKNKKDVAALKAESLISNDPARGVRIRLISKPTVLDQKPTKLEVKIGESSSSSNASSPDVKAQLIAARKQDADVMDDFPTNVISKNRRIARIKSSVRPTSSNVIAKNKLEASAKVHTSTHLPLNAVVKNQSLGKCSIANKQFVAKTEQKVDSFGHWPSDFKTQLIADTQIDISLSNLNTTTRDVNVKQQAHISDRSSSALTKKQLTAEPDWQAARNILGDISDDEEEPPTASSEEPPTTSSEEPPTTSSEERATTPSEERPPTPSEKCSTVPSEECPKSPSEECRFCREKGKLMKKYHVVPPSYEWWLKVLEVYTREKEAWKVDSEEAEKEYLAQHNPKDQQEPFWELKCCFPLPDPRTIIQAVHRRSKKS